MRSLYAQFSGLAGLLAFLNQLWSYAPLERTILIGFGTGLIVYLLLLIGDFTISRILHFTPAKLAQDHAGAGKRKMSDSSDKSTEPKAKAA